MTRLRCARACLALMCVYTLSIGATAAFAPHTFYDDFPFLAHWVDRLPPYNEHLVTDAGELYLGFAVLFGWAAWRPEPRAGPPARPPRGSCRRVAPPRASTPPTSTGLERPTQSPS